MIRNYSHKDIEFALRVLYHPEQISDEESREWFATREHRELFEELRQYKEIGLPQTEALTPNLREQWNVVNQRIRMKRKIIFSRRVAAVAASVIILICSTLLLRKPADRQMMSELHTPVSLLPEQKSVRLITGDGQKIILASSQNTQVNQLPGIERIQVDSLEGIKYSDSHKKIEHHTLEIPRGAEYMVILDDGTEVWLNSESVLRYPTKFEGKERVVELLGEGYFKVNKDNKRPFIVRTPQVDTRVLGTEFNVQAYENQPINVTLVEGSVAVKEKHGEEIVLKPGENAQVVNGNIHVEEVDVQIYTSWKEGFFYFEDVRLEDLLSELGRWYDFNVFFQNPVTKDYRFKFWADRKENFESVINRLSETATITLLINDRSVIVCSE